MLGYPIVSNPLHSELEICIKKYEPSLALFLATLCYQAKILTKFPSFFTTPTFPGTYRFVTHLQSSVTGSKTGYGYILESNESIYMVFRGSASYADLYKDVNAFLVPFPLALSGGYVHNGFYSIYTTTTKEHPYSLRDELLQTLNRLNPSKQLYISGFSLGGALATLCTLDVALNTPFTQPVLYTFASPKVGDSTFVKQFNTTVPQSFRVINDYDIVPTLPPTILGYGYRHVKTRIELHWDSGSTKANHNLRKAYFPALYSTSSSFGEELCRMNPPSFCPDTLPIRARL